MTRIVIHAGFHKTGTTSVQAMLDANRRVLSRQYQVFLKDDFEDLTKCAREFSVDPTPKMLTKVIHAAAVFFDSLDPTDPRPILMSSEDLCGNMPGRRGLDRYDAASLVLSQLAEAAQLRFGPDTDLTFYLSTRSREAWLKSTWWQNLRSTRLTLDFDAYSQQIAAAADLDQVLEDMAEITAGARVTSCPLETSSPTAFGPLTPILDLLDVPEVTRQKLKTLPPANVQPEIGLDLVFLALNRSDLTDDNLAEAKRTLRRLANKQSDSA